jgi:hypothetical protein
MRLRSPTKCEALPSCFRRSRGERFHLSELLPTAIGSKYSHRNGRTQKRGTNVCLKDAKLSMKV